MRVKTTMLFLCLAFLLYGGCSKDEETLPPMEIAKVRKPIFKPSQEKANISSLPQPDESELHVKQADGKPAPFEKKEGGQEKAESEKEDKGPALVQVTEGLRPGKQRSPFRPAVGGTTARQAEGEVASKSSETQAAGLRVFKELKKIRFVTMPGGGEKVLIWLNGKFPPHTFSLEGERPRVVCDFIDARLGGDVGRSIKAGGRMIKEIRIAPYKGSKPKVRVVLDLVRRESGDYEVQPIFYKEENIFALVVK